VLAALLSAAAVALLLQIAEPTRTAAPARHPLLEIRDGALFVWQHDYLRPMMLTGVAWNLAWFVLQAAYVPYAVRALGLSAQMVGFTLAAYGVGMVLGALMAARIVAAMPLGRAIQFGPVVSAIAAAVMVATLLAPTGWLAGLSFFLFGFGPMVWVITSTTLRQTVTPGAMLGRVSSVFLTANAGSRPLGAALGGLVGARWGEAACLWLALAGFVLQVAMIFYSRIKWLRRLPEAA
jgi:predicted MFS family arabinose efflux permease